MLYPFFSCFIKLSGGKVFADIDGLVSETYVLTCCVRKDKYSVLSSQKV